VLHIKAGAANMAGAWFIHSPVRPVRGLYRPCWRRWIRWKKAVFALSNTVKSC